MVLTDGVFYIVGENWVPRDTVSMRHHQKVASLKADNESRGTNKLTNKKSTLKTREEKH